jgi:hypothetical protein
MKAVESPSFVEATLVSPLRPSAGRAMPATPLRERVIWCVAMCAMFLITYGGCLHITAARVPVPSIAFAWERHTPFIPGLFGPYGAFDFFFVLSFFVCSTQR